MNYERIHNSPTSNQLAWSSQAAKMQHEPEDEVTGEVDEPPDDRKSQFPRTAIRKQADQAPSLLTKALHQQQSDDESVPVGFSTSASRRRSMTSTISFASTADLTSDTGFTSPARTNTPSPPPPVFQLGRWNADPFHCKPKPNKVTVVEQDRPRDPAVEKLVQKRCISFACAAKPEPKKFGTSPEISPRSQAPLIPTSEKPQQRRTCIKFACPAKPVRDTVPPAQETHLQVPTVSAPSTQNKEGSPATLRKYRSPSTGRSRRSLTPRRRPSRSPVAVRKTFLTANPTDLNSEKTRFHEFATDEPQEEDWIRQGVPPSTRRMTVDDLLEKENEIRRLGTEAEEEARQEEEEEEELENAEDEDDDVDNDDYDNELEDGDTVDGEDNDNDDDDDNFSGYSSDDDASDGYNTDNEGGFADSDDEDDSGDLQLWTYSPVPTAQFPVATPVGRRTSFAGSHSDSSTCSDMARKRGRHSQTRPRQARIRPGTPELPDSTDFVCGTLDEDRPLEDAYKSCIAQRRLEKLHVIPQDIDPSFPTSEPENEETGSYKPSNDSDNHFYIHGEMEDLHHEHGRSETRQTTSPKRYHSPPPKHHSPPLRLRGRSPNRLFDRHSPRRLVSPPPPVRAAHSPPASLESADGDGEVKSLAFRPGLIHTKSLPRTPAVLPHQLRCPRRKSSTTPTQGHLRGAIDIVKGLEHKRQRRKEKYLQKHFNRVRKGQVAERRPQPGEGAERMRELGLHMAGKLGPNHYVLSV